jgi:hypothetical protein
VYSEPLENSRQFISNIFCQGLASVNIYPDINDDLNLCPYLVTDRYDIPDFGYGTSRVPSQLRKAIDLHISCSRRDTFSSHENDVYSLNSAITGNNNGFHNTFYEMMDSVPKTERWHHGHLYGGRTLSQVDGAGFRKSSCTVRRTSATHLIDRN